MADEAKKPAAEPGKTEHSNIDLGVGNWINHFISDRRLRLVLLAAIAILLIAPLAVRNLGNIGTAFETLLLVLAIFLCALFMLVATVAVFPFDDKSTDAKAKIAEKAQKNARLSLLIFSGSILGVIVALYLCVVPIWQTLQFEFELKRLTWGAISLPDLFAAIDVNPSVGEAVAADNILDQDKIDLPFNVDGGIKDVRALLKTVSQRRAAVVTGHVKLGSLPEGHVALVAAEKVTFAKGSSIEIGSTTLVILTSDLIVESDSVVSAFRSDDVPTNAGLDFGLKGRRGANAGNIAIVVLNSLTGSGAALVDLRGQQGGQGAPGAQHDPKPPGQDASPLPGRPRWVFRSLTDDEVNGVGAELGREEPYLAATDRQLSNQNLAACKSQPGKCVAVVCAEDRDSWAIRAMGHPGEKGDDGDSGGEGGDSGTSGALSILYLPNKSLTSDAILKHFMWSNQVSILSTPLAQPGGTGGDGGKGGAAGAGGRGLAADPFGACPSGASGPKLKDGATGPKGKHGLESQGEQGRLVRLSPLFGRY